MARPDSERLARLPRFLVPAALATLALAWVFKGLFFGEVLLQADLIQLFEPLRKVFAAEVAAGNFTWARAIGNGSALLGNPLHGVAYPPNWLCLIVEPARALSILCAAHVAWGAIGAWALARERGAQAAGAWTAGAAFALCGVSLSAALMPNLGWPLAWLPWLVLSHARIRRRPGSWPPMLSLALILALLLILAEPTLLFGGLFWIAIAELRPWIRSRGRCIPWRTVAAGLLGFALALPVTWPVLRTVGESVRSAGFEREGLLQWSLHPAETLAFVAPRLYSRPEMHGLPGHWATQLWPARTAGLYHGTYWGTLVLALAAAGLFAAGRKRRELLAWLALLGLLALGRHGPIFPWLAEVPLADSWRYPAKWLTPMSLPVALFAARGVDSLRLRRCRVAAFVAAASMAAVCGMLTLGARLGTADIAWSLLGPGGPAPDWLASRLMSAGWRGLLPIVLGAGLLVRWRKPESRRSLVTGLAVVLTLDLLLAGPAIVTFAPLELYRRVPPAIESLAPEGPARVRRLWVEPAKDLRWQNGPLRQAEYHRWERDSLRLYSAASFGQDLAFPVDFEAMSPFEYARLGQMIATAPEREQSMLLGAAGVTHLASFAERDPRWATPVSLHEGRAERPLRIFANALVQPRARIVTELLPYSTDDELYRIIASGPDDLFARAAVVARDRLPSTPVPAVAVPGPVVIERDAGNGVLLRCEGGGGFLIVGIPLVKGWSATIDDEPVELFPADVAFLGLVLPAGRHQIRLRYGAW